jgi:hypothetical protein
MVNITTAAAMVSDAAAHPRSAARAMTTPLATISPMVTGARCAASAARTEGGFIVRRPETMRWPRC